MGKWDPWYFRNASLLLADMIKVRAVGEANRGSYETIGGASNTRPPPLRDVVNRYGDWIITKMRVVRHPIPSMIEKVASIITLGDFDEKKLEMNIDNFFHLFLEFAVKSPDGKETNVILLEKNQKVHVSAGRSGGLDDNQVGMNVPLGGKITFAEFIGKGENGPSLSGCQIYIYDAADCNCQQFVKTMLIGNGLWREGMEEFVVQDVERAIPNWVKRIARVGTDLAAAVESVTGGSISQSAADETVSKQMRRVAEPLLLNEIFALAPTGKHYRNITPAYIPDELLPPPQPVGEDIYQNMIQRRQEEMFRNMYSQDGFNPQLTGSGVKDIFENLKKKSKSSLNIMAKAANIAYENKGKIALAATIAASIAGVGVSAATSGKSKPFIDNFPTFKDSDEYLSSGAPAWHSGTDDPNRVRNLMYSTR